MAEDELAYSPCFRGHDPEGDRESALCETVTRRAITSLGNLSEVEDFGAGGFTPDEFRRYCWPAEQGVWAVQPAGIRVRRTAERWFEASGRWVLVHASASGRAVRGPRGRFEATPASSMLFDGFTFDYDGDGQSEIVLVVARGSHSGGCGDHRGGGIWTLRHDRVVRYAAPVEQIIGVVDADGDGRPDLVVNDWFQGDLGRAVCGYSYQPTSGNGPYLLAHSLPDGTFSLDDEVARRFAQNACSSMPSELLPLDDDEFGGPDTARWVRCARLWGVSSAGLVGAIQSSCRPPPNSNCERIEGVCPAMSLMLAWARVIPPLTLTSPPTRPEARSSKSSGR